MNNDMTVAYLALYIATPKSRLAGYPYFTGL